MRVTWPGFWASLVFVIALYVVLIIVIMRSPESVPTERVTITCPIGTLQITKVDNVWTCIQEGEAG